METLTAKKQKVASLKYDEGFNTLLDLFDQYIDALATQIEQEQDRENRDLLVLEWRHFRKTVRILRTQPDAMYDELCEDFGVPNALEPNPIESMGMAHKRLYGER